MIPWARESEFTFAGGLLNTRIISVEKEDKYRQSSSFNQDDPNFDLRPAVASVTVV